MFFITTHINSENLRQIQHELRDTVELRLSELIKTRGGSDK